MSFVQASPLAERPRDLLKQKTSARIFGTPVSLIISSFSSCQIVCISLECETFRCYLAFLPSTGGLPQQSNGSGKLHDKAVGT